MNLRKKVVLAVVGLVLTLAWWTLTGSGGGGRTVKGIPPKVWGGGGGTTTIDADFSEPGEVRPEFYCWDDSKDNPHHGESFSAEEAVTAGPHHFVIEVPPKTNVSVEFHIKGAKRGAKVKWTLTCGSKQIATQEAVCEEDYEPSKWWYCSTPIVPEAGTGEGW